MTLNEGLCTRALTSANVAHSTRAPAGSQARRRNDLAAKDGTYVFELGDGSTKDKLTAALRACRRSAQSSARSAAGCLLAMLTYFPLFEALTRYANPALYQAQAAAPVTVFADPGQCSFQFDPIGKNKFDSTSCDIAKSFLAKAGVSYVRIDAPSGAVAEIRSGATTLTAPGYPDKADPAAINKPMVVLILFVLVLYVTMVYGLWYPIVIAGATLIIGLFFLPETFKRGVDA